MVGRIATGEIEDTRKDAPPASEFSRKGGAARAKALPKKKRIEIARKAAESRWKKR
jgi:hypothetical protein